MSQNLRNYTRAVYAMDAVVQRTPKDKWDAQSPCSDWTARQVIGHFMFGLQRVAAVATGADMPAEKAEADVAGPNPATSWAATRDNVFDALDHPGSLDKPFQGPFGPGSLDGFLQLHTLDCMLHTWDIAKAAGIDAHIPADMAEAGTAGLQAAGDGIRQPGLFGPAVDVAADADPVTKFAAMAGRQP